jgi:hypothetical protein
VKGKVNYGLNNGVPVVGTAVASEGMNLVDRKDVYIANSGREFLDGIVLLSKDKALWKRLQVGGVEAMKKSFGVEIAAKVLLDSLAEIGAPVAPASQHYTCPYAQQDMILFSNEQTLARCPMGLPYPSISYASDSSLITNIIFNNSRILS